MDLKQESLKRPIYESDRDREAERAFIGEIERIKGCHLEKLPYSYRADCLVFREQTLIGVAELKVRGVAYAQIPTVFISLGKFIATIQLAEQLRGIEKSLIRSLFFFKFVDGSYYYEWRPEHELEIRQGGRNQPRDSADREPLIHLPKKYIKELK